jgi:hypothetical protein
VILHEDPIASVCAVEGQQVGPLCQHDTDDAEGGVYGGAAVFVNLLWRGFDFGSVNDFAAPVVDLAVAGARAWGTCVS